MWRVLIVGFAVIVQAAQASGNSADTTSGERLFANHCRTCHQVGHRAKDRVGPHLNNLFGRRAGSHEDFRYSAAMRQAAERGLEWHADTLDLFLTNPEGLVPRTRMGFDGFPNAGDRADVIAYLRTYSDSPADIPEADPTAAATQHDLDPAILAIVGDPEYGEYLSSECTTCHQSDGGDSGIPSITLWQAEDFVVAMHAYKSGFREHPVMQMIAKRLSDEEIAALAEYFGSLDP